MEILQYTALELGCRIQNREIGVKEALTAVLDRIEERESSLHAYIHLDPERAMRQAEQVQEQILNNQAAPTDEEMTEAAGEMLYECLSQVLEDPQYGEKSMITVHVQESKKDNVWEIPSEDIDALVTALIDTIGTEEAFTLS